MRHARSRTFVWLIALCGALVTAPPSFALGPLEVVSVSSSGERANGNSFGGPLSRDGRYVAFRSDASNLVPSDSNGTDDVFLRDRTLESTKASGIAFVSDDGRFVAFDTIGAGIFVRDLLRGKTVEVPNTCCSGPYLDGLSANGRLVAVTFGGGFSPLVETLFDRKKKTFTPLCSGGVECSNAAFSRDGRTISMWLEPTSRVPRVVALDRTTGHRENLDIFPDGSPIGASSFAFSRISDDGNRIGFSADAVVPGVDGDDGDTDVFVRDRAADTTQVLTVTDAGEDVRGLSFGGWISGDGSVAAFESDAFNAPQPDGGSPYADVYVRELDQ